MFNEKPFESLIKSLQNCSMQDVPASALLMIEDKAFGPFNNAVYEKRSHLFHAEILVIEHALKEMNIMDFKDYKAILYSTIEPCCMCLAFASLTRISKIIYYADENKFGGVSRIYTLGSAFFRPELLCMEKKEVKTLLNDFFKSKR